MSFARTGIAAWLLGAATVWPLGYLVFFVAVVAAANPSGFGGDADLPISEGLLWGLHLATILLILMLSATYFFNALRNPRIPDEKRSFWAIAVLVGTVVVMPYYWWCFIRPIRSVDGDSGDPSEQSV